MLLCQFSSLEFNSSRSTPWWIIWSFRKWICISIFIFVDINLCLYLGTWGLLQLYGHNQLNLVLSKHYYLLLEFWFFFCWYIFYFNTQYGLLDIEIYRVLKIEIWMKFHVQIYILRNFEEKTQFSVSWNFVKLCYENSINFIETSCSKSLELRNTKIYM